MPSSDKHGAPAGSAAGAERVRAQQAERRVSGERPSDSAKIPAPAERSAGRSERGAQRRRPPGAGVRLSRYLVATTAWSDSGSLAQALAAEPGIAVLRTIKAPVTQGPAPRGESARIVVIETTSERAAALARRPDIYVEADQVLGRGQPPRPAPGDADILTAPVGDLAKLSVEVGDDAGRPIDGAAVWIFGRGVPAAGYTGPDGRVDLPITAETVADIAEIQVRPPRGCWPVRLSRPRVRDADLVQVACERITTTFSGFPDRAIASWGAQAMGFSRLPPTHRGAGVRIAIVDSGAASGHPDLTGRISDGRDVIGQDDKTWREDRIGTGTHLAVLIGGQDDGTGVVGLAPEAELHVLRTTPGGHCSELIESLDYCIDEGIDIALVPASLVAASPLLAARIAEARSRGVACIAAAGDSGGAVGVPAAFPGVLSVGAVARLGTFPPDSGLATQLTGPPTPDGFFVPKFACTGPGIDCCGPGMAIVSGLPPASYGPMSGSGIAAGHVAAVAALVLAHHPQFAWPGGGPPVARDASRVDRLFQIIVAACRPLPQLGPFRVGAGLPDAGVAVGVAPWGDFATLPAAHNAEEGLAANGADTLAGLEAVMRSAGLLPTS